MRFHFGHGMSAHRGWNRSRGVTLLVPAPVVNDSWRDERNAMLALCIARLRKTSPQRFGEALASSPLARRDPYLATRARWLIEPGDMRVNGDAEQYRDECIDRLLDSVRQFDVHRVDGTARHRASMHAWIIALCDEIKSTVRYAPAGAVSSKTAQSTKIVGTVPDGLIASWGQDAQLATAPPPSLQHCIEMLGRTEPSIFGQVIGGVRFDDYRAAQVANILTGVSPFNPAGPTYAQTRDWYLREILAMLRDADARDPARAARIRSAVFAMCTEVERLTGATWAPAGGSRGDSIWQRQPCARLTAPRNRAERD